MTRPDPLPPRRGVARAASFAALVLAACFAVPAFAQDAPADAPPGPAGDDPVPALRQAAEAARGDARAGAFAALARACEERLRWTDAADAWRAAFDAKPDAAWAVGEGRALLAFAEQILASGEPGSAIRAAFEDARVALRRARSLGANDVAVRIGLARCLAADGRTADQVAELEAAVKEFPGDPAPRRALGFALYNAARYADAIQVLKPLSDVAPADLNLSLTVAACARETGNEDLAVAAASRTIQAHPDDRRAWLALWDVYAPASRWSELADRMEEEAGRLPGSAYAAYWCGCAETKAARFDPALKHLEAAWTLNPKFSEARLQAARILLDRRHDRDGAAALIRATLVHDPQSPDANVLLTYVAMRRSEDGDHLGAMRELEALASRRRDDPIVLANLAVAYRYVGRYDDAEKTYLHAIDVAPGDAQLRNDLGLNYLVQGRDEEARRAFEKAAEVDAEAKDGPENLGWMSQRDGRLDEAFRWYHRAYEIALRRGDDTSKYRRELDDVRFPLPPLPPPR